MSILIVYDNTVRPGELIAEVIGRKSFGDVIVKRERLRCHMRRAVEEIFRPGGFSWEELDSLYDVEALSGRLGSAAGEFSGVLHIFSSQLIRDPAAAALTLRKVEYIEEDVELEGPGGACAGCMFHGVEGYAGFLRRVLELRGSEQAVGTGGRRRLACRGLTDIGEFRSFIRCLTGSFDSRYFNTMEETDYILRKSSSDKVKIKKEYTYYRLLPENMRRWFVMPFDYRETDTSASYAMERLYMTDLAVKWVHGSIGKAEFRQILDMYFTFFRERSSMEVTGERLRAVNQEVYVDKVRRRIEELKKLPEFSRIALLLSANDEYPTVDSIFRRYLELKEKAEAKSVSPNTLVIGHGDPCFSNTMYSYSTRTLKFIDPRGALTEEELYTDPYYDVAKLSHSICGNYDFFNSAAFDIAVDESMSFRLTIPFDNREYKRMFREKLEENGYDYIKVRVYEASLFLSMLPLHMDYPHKVFGFLLNAVNILKEVEEIVR